MCIKITKPSKAFTMFSQCYVSGLVSNTSKTIGNYALDTKASKTNRLEHNVKNKHSKRL